LLLAILAWATGAGGQAAPANEQAPPADGQLKLASPCNEKRTMVAVAQALGVNFVINRFDAWVLGEEWARTDFESWSRNLSLGWEWDENALHTNMFMHPYHGALYFDAARANCLSYWESVPITLLGSWTWEYLGETFRPSLNDFLMTTFGGMALGEVLHRVGASVRDTEVVGKARLYRELGALLIDPLGGLNRLFRGDWGRVGSNPPEHDSGAYVVQTRLGARRARVTGPQGHSVYAPTFLLDVSFGDAFEQEHQAPFDVFTLRAQVSPDGGGLNVLSATGRLYGREVTSAGARHRHQLVVIQRYDYLNNPVHQFGEQSVQTGLLSRWRLGGGGYTLRTEVTGDLIPLGAIDAPMAGVGDRAYDFGPGLGAVVDLALEYDGVSYVSFYNRLRYLHTVSGASSDHSVLLSGLTLTVPITKHWGVGAFMSGTERHSRYSLGADDRRSYLETRVYVSWTSVGGFQGGSSR